MIKILIEEAKSKVLTKDELEEIELRFQEDTKLRYAFEVHYAEEKKLSILKTQKDDKTSRLAIIVNVLLSACENGNDTIISHCIAEIKNMGASEEIINYFIDRLHVYERTLASCKRLLNKLGYRI